MTPPVRILLVEDNALNRDMLSRRLMRRGFEVLLALDGAEALAITESALPALVLMDVSLPVLDGLEVTRRLKANPATSAIPILVLTAHALAEDRDRAFAAGCNDFETKPIDLPKLLEKMDALLTPRGGS